MKTKAVFRNLVTFALAWFCVVHVSPREASARRLAPGDYDVTLRHQGRERYYILHIPPHARSGNSLPLVFNFHGGGGNARGNLDYSGLNAVADSEGFAVVYPEGTTNPRFHRRLASWNVGPCCGPAKEQKVDDVAFTVAVLEDVAARIAVDHTRVYATGLSNGAMMSYRLAIALPDRFAAIAPIAGTLQGRPKEPVAVLHIHSVDDPRAKYYGGESKFPITNEVAMHHSVESVLRHWSDDMSCESAKLAEQVNKSGHSAEMFVSSGCRGGVEVAHWRLRGGGHVWPGRPAVLPEKLVGAPTYVIDANREIWRFFRRFRNPHAPPLAVGRRAPAGKIVPLGKEERRKRRNRGLLKRDRRGRTFLDQAMGEGIEVSFDRSSVQVESDASAAADLDESSGSYRDANLGLRAGISLYSKLRVAASGVRAFRLLANFRLHGTAIDLDSLGETRRYVRAAAGASAFYMPKPGYLFLFAAGASIAAEDELVGEASLRPYVLALGAYRIGSSQFRLLYGGALTYSYGRGLLLPALGFAWRASEKWTVSTLLPLYASVGYRPSRRVALQLTLIANGEQYEFENRDSFAGANDKLLLRHTEARSLVGAVVNISDGVQLIGQLGVAGPRRVAVVSGDDELYESRMRPAGFAKLALKWSWGQPAL